MEENTIDKQWARKYILDPLTAPEPNQETGPGSSHFNHLRASYTPQPPPTQNPIPVADRDLSLNSHRSESPRRRQSVDVRNNKSFRVSVARYGREPLHGHSSSSDSSSSQPNPFGSAIASSSTTTADQLPPLPDTPPPHGPGEAGSVPNAGSPPMPSRYRSLSERFRGDRSNQPLRQLEQENRAANRARRHRKHASEVDVIDSLDTIGGTYHHGGPYDAALASRNTVWQSSPVAAVHNSNLTTTSNTSSEQYVNAFQPAFQPHDSVQGPILAPAESYELATYMADDEYLPEELPEPEPQPKKSPYKRFVKRVSRGFRKMFPSRRATEY